MLLLCPIDFGLCVHFHLLPGVICVSLPQSHTSESVLDYFSDFSTEEPPIARWAGLWSPELGMPATKWVFLYSISIGSTVRGKHQSGAQVSVENSHTLKLVSDTP